MNIAEEVNIWKFRLIRQMDHLRLPFGDLRENPSNSEKSCILPKKAIFGNSTNLVNETSS